MTRRRLLRWPSSIRLARYDLQCVWMKPQIVPMAVGRMGVVDLPGARLVLEFDFAPVCEALIAQHGLDAGALFGTRGRSASTCPGANTPAAKTRPSRICLMVGMEQLRAPRVPDKRRRAGSVPMLEHRAPYTTICALLAAIISSDRCRR